ASGDGNPLAPIVGAATTAVGDLARRGAPPAVPPAGGESIDPFAGMFRAAGDFVRSVTANPPPSPPRVPRPPVSGPSVPPIPRVREPVLNDLPDTLQQYGIRGVPGLPGGAPHAQEPRRILVDRTAAPPPEAPPDPSAPAPKKKSSDEAVVPVVLTGLGIL